MNRRLAQLQLKQRMQKHWINLVTFNTLMQNIRKQLWETKFIKMFNKGRHNNAAKIQEAFRNYLKRKNQNPQQRFGIHVRR